MERSHDELSVPRPEHHALLAEAHAAEAKAARYKQRSRWGRLALVQKASLVLAVVLELATCVLTVVLGLLLLGGRPWKLIVSSAGACCYQGARGLG